MIWLQKIREGLLTIDVSKVECFTKIEVKRETGTSMEEDCHEKCVDRGCGSLRLWLGFGEQSGSQVPTKQARGEPE